MNIIEKYSPQTLSEIVFTNEQDEFFIKQFVAGKHHIDNLLFYGPQGAQKSKTAQIIARAIAGNDHLIIDESVNDFLKRGAKIKEYLHNTIFFNTSPQSVHRRCVLVVDELAELEKLDKLWTVMDDNKDKLMLIATTNDLMKVHASMRSRCMLCKFDVLTHTQFVKRAQHILSSENVVLDEPTIELCLETYSPKKYDIRDQMRVLQNMITLDRSSMLSNAIALLKRSQFTVK